MLQYGPALVTLHDQPKLSYCKLPYVVMLDWACLIRPQLKYCMPNSDHWWQGLTRYMAMSQPHLGW